MVTNRSTKTVKLLHLEQFAIYSIIAINFLVINFLCIYDDIAKVD